jgi:mRNA-degrading endonuclease toxin of MazEF toxin-antitoxin module
MEAGHLYTWPRNPLLRDSKRRPVVVLSPPYEGRATVLVVPLSSDLTSRTLPLRPVIAATETNGLRVDSLALCDQLTCVLISLLSEPFGCIDKPELARLRRLGALALGLLPGDLTGGQP